jgi:predicted nucleic acid-binding protein
VFTVDASVYVNALNSAEKGSLESERFLEYIFQRPWPVYSPTLLLVEMAAAISRVFDDARRGLALAQAARALPGQIWVPLEESLADEASRLAAEHRLRGADAVYAAVANRYRTALVTCDRQQLDRLRPALPVLTPAEALTHRDEAAGADQD